MDEEGTNIHCWLFQSIIIGSLIALKTTFIFYFTAHSWIRALTMTILLAGPQLKSLEIELVKKCKVSY